MKAILLASMLALAACGTTTVPIRSTQYEVIQPPENFFVCNKPEIEPGQLTDLQVALLLIRYEENITECSNNLLAVRQFLRDNIRTQEPTR